MTTLHHGSAYDESAGGWESYVNTALRQELNPGIADAYSQNYCGSTGGGAQGDVNNCRAALIQALDTTIGQLTSAYGTDNPDAWTCARSNTGDRCNPKQEDIQFQAVGLQKVPDLAWINRPTFQQVAQFSTSRAEQPKGGVQAQAVPGLPATGAPRSGDDGLPAAAAAALLLLAFTLLARRVSASRGTR
jgi:hypothetical protein